MTTYLEAFPDYDDVLPVIEGFQDSSYRNDACPSMINPELHLRLFLDYKAPELREFDFPKGIRLVLIQLSDENMHMVVSDDSDVLFESKEMPEMLEFIERHRQSHSPAP